MLFNDTVQHNKSHVHVTYGEYRASVGIDGEITCWLTSTEAIQNVGGLVSSARRRSLCSLEQSCKR